MKDARGHEYEELIAFQNSHLKLWESRLRPQLYSEVQAYVRRCNRAALADGKHQVYRGSDLVAVIMTWPELPSCYEPVLGESVI